MKKLTVNAYSRYPGAGKKSTLYKLLLLSVLCALIVFFIIIEKSYITAFTLLLAGGVYYLYDQTEGDAKQSLTVSLTDIGLTIGNDLYKFEDMVGVNVFTERDDTYVFVFSRKRRMDFTVYCSETEGVKLLSGLQELNIIPINIKKTQDIIHYLIHILRL